MSGIHIRVRVGAESYALPVENVREVAALGVIAPVPGSAIAAVGVCNLRGQVLPVFDLATVLGVGSGGTARLLIAEEGGRAAGFAVDEVTDVGELPEALQDARSELLAGAALVDNALVGVIDVQRLFDALTPEAA